MGGRKHLGREKLVTQLRKLAKGKGIALAKPNASRGKVILPLVLHLSHTIVNLRCMLRRMLRRWRSDPLGSNLRERKLESKRRLERKS